MYINNLIINRDKEDYVNQQNKLQIKNQLKIKFKQVKHFLMQIFKNNQLNHKLMQQEM